MAANSSRLGEVISKFLRVAFVISAARDRHLVLWKHYKSFMKTVPPKTPIQPYNSQIDSAQEDQIPKVECHFLAMFYSIILAQK
jgi:hypothetical protein